MPNKLEDCYGYTLLLENIPKILAMFLKNEGVLAIPHPAREMGQSIVSREEEFLYKEWLCIFKQLFKCTYPVMDIKQVDRLARTNAEYLLSVFTPITVTCIFSTKQLNRVLDHFDTYVKSDRGGDFFIAIRTQMLAFLKMTELLRTEDPTCDNGANAPLINNCIYSCNEYFSEVFSTTYGGSYAQLFELLSYEIGITYTTHHTMFPEYFVPRILLQDEELMQKWLREIKTPSITCPQGKMIKIAERGTYENFIRKADRCFRATSLSEASAQTYKTLQVYLNNTKGFNNSLVHKQLAQININPDVEEIANINQPLITVENR